MVATAQKSQGDGATFTELIKTRARELGFDKIGIVRAEPLSDERAQLEEWLRRGYHGEMPYMARDPEERSDPWKIFPHARSVIVVGVNYYTSHQHEVSTQRAETGNTCVTGRLN